jgi:hypothetical protein
MDPGRGHGRGLFCSTFYKRLHEDDGESHACGVDDVVGAISGRCLYLYILG